MDRNDRRGRMRAVERARAKYESYNPDVWVRVRFYELTGGYVVVHRRRLENSRKSGNEEEKFRVELEMSEVFARCGNRIEMLDEDPRRRSYDVNINGVPADLKYIHSMKKIERRGLEARKYQQAQLVLFRFDKMSNLIMQKLKKLSMMKIHGKYYVQGEKTVYDF